MNGPERWLAIGDSITWGYPEGPSVSWTHHVAAALERPCDNQGLNGDTLEGMAKRLPPLLARGRYAFAAWMGGSNDVFWGFGVGTLIHHGARIAAMLAEGGIPFGVELPIPLADHPRLEAQLHELRAHLRSEYPVVIDFPTAFPAGERAALLPDGVHPSAEGYRRMAELALPVLRSL